jgi:hypothetical protein
MFSEEHIAGAINIPLKELDERAPRELKLERPVSSFPATFRPRGRGHYAESLPSREVLRGVEQ